MTFADITIVPVAAAAASSEAVVVTITEWPSRSARDRARPFFARAAEHPGA